jgi:hypothetical protein
VWPAVLLFYATLAPPELGFSVGTLVFHLYRVLLLALVPVVIFAFFSGRVRFRFPDLLILFVSIWMIIAITANYDWTRGMETGGVSALDLLMSYLVGRISISSPEHLRTFLKLIAPGVLISGLSLLVESVAGRNIFRPALGAITGNLNGGLGQDFRLGLLRGTGLFWHPIIGSLQLASCLPLYLMAGRRSIGMRMGVAGSILSVFALSSAGIMALVTGAFLSFYDVVQRCSRDLSWRFAIVSLIAVGALVHYGSKSGIVSVIFRYLTFSPESGFYRTLIWEYGSADVARRPIIGIGFEAFTRPVWMYSTSVDAHWLLVALQFGLPAAIALFAASVAAVVLLGRAAARFRGMSKDRNLLVGTAISVAVMIVFMFTVALWGHTYSWYMLLLGMAVRLSYGFPATARNRSPVSSEFPSHPPAART